MTRTFAALACLAVLAAASQVMARGTAFSVLSVRAQVRPSAVVHLDVKTPAATAVNADDVLKGLSFEAGGLKPVVVLDAWAVPGLGATIRRLSIDF